MNAHFVPRCLILVLGLVLLILPAGCSDDADPTAPVGDNNTPALPTVDNPTDELPATSDLLAVEEAMLGNFSPKVTENCTFIETLNENAIALAFRLDPDHCRLMVDDAPCPPGSLKWAAFGLENWSDCVLGTAEPCFEYLDSRGGTHYYGLNARAYWMVQDLNCRLAGGDLVTINSADENTFIHDLRQTWLPGEALALGLYDWGRANNDWAWRSGEPVTYVNWVSGEPNNYGGEYFAMMYGVNSLWNDCRSTLMNAVMETYQQLEDPGPDSVPVLLLGESPLYLGGMGDVTELPRIVRKVYWTKIFQKTLGAGATYSEEHSYTSGTSETNGMSFGWSIGISTELGWGPVSVKIESEFHQDFSREVTVSEETTLTKTYECTAPPDKTVIFALWQLRERFMICDAEGESWTDSKYELDGALPYLDQGLEQEYLQTIYFDQPTGPPTTQ